MFATALKRTPSPMFSCKEILWIQFFWFISLKHPFGHVLQSLVKNLGKTYTKAPVPEFLFLIKLQKETSAEMFCCELCEIVKSTCRTPPVSASNFTSTIFTLRPRKTYIYVFPAFLFLIFPSHFMFLLEARNKSIWFYTKFWFKKGIFEVLLH